MSSQPGSSASFDEEYREVSRNWKILNVNKSQHCQKLFF